jgi:very-short-patch-repair endonuclease
MANQARHKNLSLARTMKKRMTPAEAKLWSRLRCERVMGVKFRRQVTIGPYIVDFAARTPRIVVEADGGHHAEQAEEDEARSAFLEWRGYVVLRFWNGQILYETDAVVEAIAEAVHWGLRQAEFEGGG